MMKASELFHKIEEIIPLKTALKGDYVGYMGDIDPKEIEVNKILLLMDYIPPKLADNNEYEQFDLLILHHPPLIQPVIPTYVIHSNWDIISGGACDALADCLNIEIIDVLDEATGIGRIGRLKENSVNMGRFVREVLVRLKLDDVRLLNCNKFQKIDKISLVSGFGLQPDYIQMAVEKGSDVIISGDLTHKGAIFAKIFDISIIDATHYATELPGLCRLGQLIAKISPEVIVRDNGMPWFTSSIKVAR